MVKVSRKYSAGITISNNLRSLCRALILIALIVDLYLAFIGITGESVVGCGPNSGCDAVMQSKWSKFIGIPVSLFALPIYFALTYYVGKLKGHYDAAEQRRSWRAIISLATLLIGAGIWFTILQIFVIKAICPFCMVAHICGIAAGVILFLNVPVMDTPKGSGREKIVYVSPRRFKRRIIPAAGLLVIFILSQIFSKPATHVIKPIMPPQTANAVTNAHPPQTASQSKVLTNITFTSGNVQPINNQSGNQPDTPGEKAPNIVSIHRPDTAKTNSGKIHRINIAGAEFEFDLDEVPYIGSVDAPTKILSLFDYTCHYCREMHHHLMAIVSVYTNKIGIINLPVPLDATCNPIIPRTPKAHQNACEYAKIGLAVWRANRSLYPQFEKYVFTGSEAPTIENVRIYASNLIGSENLAKAMSDPWITNTLKLSTSIYATNVFYLGQSQMPQVIIGTNLISGFVQNTGVLVEQLEKQYKISGLK